MARGRAAAAPPERSNGRGDQVRPQPWDALTLFLTDAHFPMDNNASENALRICALLRKNFLFVGHDAAGENLAAVYSLIATCEVNGFNPVEYIADVVMPVQSHPASRIDELLSQHWQPSSSAPAPSRLRARFVRWHD